MRVFVFLDYAESLLKGIFHLFIWVVKELVSTLLLLVGILVIIGIAAFPWGWLWYFGGRILERHLERKKKG